MPVTEFDLGLDLIVGDENAEFIFEDHFDLYFWFRSFMAFSLEAFGTFLIAYEIYYWVQNSDMYILAGMLGLIITGSAILLNSPYYVRVVRGLLEDPVVLEN